MAWNSGQSDFHTQSIETILTEYAQIPYAYGDIQTETVFDRTHDHSLLGTEAGAALGGRLRVAMAGVSRRRWLLTFASTTSPRRIPAYGAGVARGLSLDG